MNKDKIEAYLAAQGFEIIHPQELPFRQQMEVFRNARRIVAPFGAALANAVFCSPDVRMCIIATKKVAEFDRLFQWRSIAVYQATAHMQKNTEARTSAQFYNYVAEMIDLQKFVDMTR